MRPLVAAGAHSRPRNVLTVLGVLVLLSFASFLG
jgi:hypothetical protein